MAPAELVVAVAARDAELSYEAVTTALSDLARQGVTITAVPEAPAAAGAQAPAAAGAQAPAAAGAQARAAAVAGWVPRAAKMARSPWVVPWQAGPHGGDHDESYLLDLACARECAQADAVGYAAGSGYAYVTSLDPALARREFFDPDGLQNSDRGLRLFSLS